MNNIWKVLSLQDTGTINDPLTICGERIRDNSYCQLDNVDKYLD
jgi:hypothetical protein